MNAAVSPSLPLAALLARRSLGVEHLVEPGPDNAALATQAGAALRASDHADLVSYRLRVVRGDARRRPARPFTRAGRRTKALPADILASWS